GLSEFRDKRFNDKWEKENCVIAIGSSSQSRYDQSDWHKWVKANWSGETWTKNLGVERKSGELTICFTTRWSPPTPVLRRLTEIYPSVQFKFSGYDHQNCWDCGGDELDVNTWKWASVPFPFISTCGPRRTERGYQIDGWKRS